MALWTTIAEKAAAVRTRRAIARRLADLDVTPNQTLRGEIEEWAAEHGDRLALVGAAGTERLSYDDLARRAARWARWTILHGIDRGEPVGLVMADRPERVAAWTGIAAAGAVAALLDPRRDGPALAAAIAAVAPRHLAVDAALLPRFESAAPHLTAMAAVWIHGPHAMAYPRLDEALDELSPERLRPADRRPISARDDALWLPSATGDPVRLSHRRVIRRLHAAAAACATGPGDRLLLAEAAAVDALAPGLTLTTGGVTVFGTASPSTDAATTGSAPPRADLVARIDPAAAALRVERPAPSRLVLWRDGDLLTASGHLLWHDDDA